MVKIQNIITISNIAIIASVVTIALPSAIYGYIQYSKRKWIKSLQRMYDKYHGYITKNNENDLPQPANCLFIINPASGSGRAQKLFKECLKELENTNMTVQVYITKSEHDLQTLVETKMKSKLEQGRYQKLVVLGGDSTIMELIQQTLIANNGKWPYPSTPILHLPGGSSNVLSSNCHGYDCSIEKIISNANTIQFGNIIQCTSPSSAKYGLHVAFGGIQEYLISTIDQYRSSVYAALGEFGLFMIMISTMLSLTFTRDTPSPAFITVMISEQEAKGMNLQFDVSRFSKKGEILVVYRKHYVGFIHWIRTIMYMMSGKMGKDICQVYDDSDTNEKKESDFIFNNDKELKIVKTSESWTISGDGHYKIGFDGSTKMVLEGEQITFSVIPGAVPYLTFKDAR